MKQHAYPNYDAEGIHPLWWLAPAAVTLRLLLFLGRGDYVAFDEGWYLLLGGNLMGGDGYTLSGLRHIALSPLFPILAGALDLVLGSPVWAGRIVAALTSGLLVIPCWFLFGRLTDRRTALVACAFVAALPSLAPFVAAFWIGADLWVGAEPVLHLFLYSGIALFLRALERRRIADWALAGLAFALAYLARPEAVIVFGLLGLAAGAMVVLRRTPRALLHAAGFGLVFALAAGPYWLYLHDSLGHWALTGRGVQVTIPAMAGGETDRPDGASAIERMLLQDDTTYVHRLFSLDATGTRMASRYWGVPERADAPPATRNEPVPAPEPGDAPIGATTGREAPAQVQARESGRAVTAADTAAQPREAAARLDPPARPASGLSSGPVRYARALGVVVPWFLWPFIAVGLAAPGWPRRKTELLVTAPLLIASVAIAFVVAVDPRTQLFLAPVLALYGAVGIRTAGSSLQQQLRDLQLKPGFVAGTLAAVVLTFLLGTSARRLYLSTTLGSPHHIVGAENRVVGEALDRLLPADAAIMSWHPAIAVFARRDWRVLPRASFAEIVRYAHAIGCEYIVLSAYYPSPSIIEEVPARYLMLRVPAGAMGERWKIELTGGAENYALGVLRPE